ncbi:MAG: hypothetical protein BWZ07_02380 [Alphaproteobacteria bacterium ADurb.BinA280]|nr:MAG: hypothetical protein BWZ07_02380 [Alphaproteobacteria bacterium ADurb.BinA280]
MEVSAEAALIAQGRDAQHHRVAVLTIGEKLQTGRLATDLVASVVEIGQILDLWDRQHAHIGVALSQAKDHGLVQQRVEDAFAREGLEQTFGNGVDAALLCHIFTEQKCFRIFRHQVVQGLIDLDGKMLRRLMFGQFFLATKNLFACLRIVRARCF